MNPNEDFCNFSLKTQQRLQALSQRMEAVNSLLNFFNSEYIINRGIANECESIVDFLIADFHNSMKAFVQLLDDEE